MYLCPIPAQHILTSGHPVT